MRLEVRPLDGNAASDDEVAALVAALERLVQPEPAHQEPAPSRWRLAGRIYDGDAEF